MTIGFTQLNPLTDDFAVNTTPIGNKPKRHHPHVAIDMSGNSVVVWNSENIDGSDYGVLAQRFDNEGNKVGIEFQVNTFEYLDQQYPTVAMDGVGNFVVVWESLIQDGSAWGIFGQRFDRNGNFLGGEFQVNTTFEIGQNFPQIAMNPHGDFVVVWAGYDSDNRGVFGQKFDKNGNKVGVEFQANTYTTGLQGAGRVAIDLQGNFAVMWVSTGQDELDGGRGVYAQRYDKDANRIGNEFAVPTNTANEQSVNDIAMNWEGEMIISWESNALDQTGVNEEIFAQRYDALGNPVGSEFQVNTYTTLDQRFSKIIMNQDGSFAIFWYSSKQDNNGTSPGNYGQLFDKNGNRVGNEFVLHSNEPGLQIYPSLASRNNYLMAVWEGPNAIDDFGVTGRLFNAYSEAADICADAVPLPLNEEPCGNLSIIAPLKTSNDFLLPPTSSCDSTYAGNGIWFTVSIPSTGNLLIQQTGVTNIAPVIEVGLADCANTFIPIKCEVISDIPYAITLEDLPPNNTVYLRVWDENNTLVDALDNPVVELSAHILPADPAEWELCDFRVSNTNPNGGGNKLAVEFLMQYEEGATPTEVETIKNELLNEGATLLKECACNDGNPLQLWADENPILTETRRRAAKSKSNVDTTNFNYLIETREFQSSANIAGQQKFPTVGIDDDGNFVLTWTDNGQDGGYFGVIAQRFSANGNPLGAAFVVNTHTDGYQTYPSVAMAGNGQFIISWISYNQDLVNEYTRHGQLYAADGSKIGEEFQVSAPYNSGVSYADMDGAGNFVISYFSNIHPDTTNIYVNHYDASGNLTTGFPIRVNEYDNDTTYIYPNIAMNESGAFVVVYSNNTQDTYARRYDASGNAIGGEFLANTTTNGSQWLPDVGINSSGAYVVIWEAQSQTSIGELDVYGQLFDNQGNKVGSEFRANTFDEGKQLRPKVDIYEDGSFLVVWVSEEQDGDLGGIYGQLFDNQGNKVGAEFRVNDYTENDQIWPQLAINKKGDVVITWQSYGQDNNGSGVFAKRFSTSFDTGVPVLNLEQAFDKEADLGVSLDYSTATYNNSSNSSEVKVAIIDTGVKDNHPRLQNGIWTNPAPNTECLMDDIIGYDFVDKDGSPEDNDGHGTSVNGMIIKDFPNDLDLNLINLKFYEDNKGSIFDAVCGIYYAINQGAKVINLSWGFESLEFPTILNNALQFAALNDVLITTSAGNTGKNNDVINKYPANLDISTMIVVAAYQLEFENGTPDISNYSSYGATKVDLAAYGFVQTTGLADTLHFVAGTSLAAPIVARTAAIIRAKYPELTALEVKDCILNSATIENLLTGKVATNGILNHDGALACADSKANCAENPMDISVFDGSRLAYQTQKFITSDVVLNGNMEVLYLAKDSIVLEAGFTVTAGTPFHAVIGDCSLASPLQNSVEEIQKIVPTIPTSPKSPTRTDISLNIFPNPSTDNLHLTLDLPTSSYTTISLYNMDGQMVQNIRNGLMTKGTHSVATNISSFPSGIYSLNIKTAIANINRKIIVSKK